MSDECVYPEPLVSGAMSRGENDYGDAEQINRDDTMTEQNMILAGADANSEARKKYDPKDPLRPRRKKARRACFACQRAHLTCGKFLHSAHRRASITVPPIGMATAPLITRAIQPWLVYPPRFRGGGHARGSLTDPLL